jgi:hypothetical protein
MKYELTTPWAEALALQAVLTNVLLELKSLDPGLADAIARGFDWYRGFVGSPRQSTQHYRGFAHRVAPATMTSGRKDDDAGQHSRRAIARTVAWVLTRYQPNPPTISPAACRRSGNIAPIAAVWGRQPKAVQGCQTSRNSPADRTDSAAGSAENVRGAGQGMSGSSTRHMSTPIP